MSLLLVSNLLFDSDQEKLFDVDELRHDSVWISARVYKSIKEGSLDYEVWSYEWNPSSNEEKPRFVQAFQTLEDAKSLAIQIASGKNPSSKSN